MNFKPKNRFWALLACVTVLAGSAVAIYAILQQPPATPAVGGSSTTTKATAPTETAPATRFTQTDTAFSGTVLEAGEGWLLVEVDAGGSLSGQVRVNADSSLSLPAAGVRVAVWHTGQMMPSLPPQLVATRIEVLQ